MPNPNANEVTFFKPETQPAQSRIKQVLLQDTKEVKFEAKGKEIIAELTKKYKNVEKDYSIVKTLNTPQGILALGEGLLTPDMLENIFEIKPIHPTMGSRDENIRIDRLAFSVKVLEAILNENGNGLIALRQNLFTQDDIKQMKQDIGTDFIKFLLTNAFELLKERSLSYSQVRRFSTPMLSNDAVTAVNERLITFEEARNFANDEVLTLVISEEGRRHLRYGQITLDNAQECESIEDYNSIVNARMHAPVSSAFTPT